MSITSIDASMLKMAFLSAAQNLESKKEWINDMNVFPVPDGDTGTNMTLTILSATNEVQSLTDVNMATLCGAISKGSLRGARGNSGVILSQLLRGFTRYAQDYENLDCNHLAEAFKNATETAYKAVMKPKEGTILTVARGMSDKASQIASTSDDVLVFLKEVIDYGDEVLAKTPEMLPVLKQAGVVDSGGQGLMQAFKGAYMGLSGEIIADENIVFASDIKTRVVDDEFDSLADIKFGYCTEFIIQTNEPTPDEEINHIKEFLETQGDSIVCVTDSDLIKIHVHTNDPGNVLQKALTYGELINIKIDNMREEFRQNHPGETASKPIEHKKFGFVSVCSGDGMTEIFKGIGADIVISGGQTMNPSTQDLVEACGKINADHIFILPNNKNIILAAEQANELVDTDVRVIPTKTIPQGIAALISFLPDLSAQENETSMTAAIARIKSGEITSAVRDTELDGHAIHKGDYMFIGDAGIIANGISKQQVLLDGISALVSDDSELISIYKGKEVSKFEAEEYANQIRAKYPDVEVELDDGDQPVYDYIVSVE